MGEMLENIAHQWKELSTIVLLHQVWSKKKFNILSDDEFHESVNHIKMLLIFIKYN